MKRHIFGQCDKCIGITPCKVLKNGSVVCEYCNDEVKLFDTKNSSSETELPLREQVVQ
ncbi:MAG: hypothetical protein PVH84_07345 [Candidatus Aminicenantes bacterium]